MHKRTQTTIRTPRARATGRGKRTATNPTGAPLLPHHESMARILASYAKRSNIVWVVIESKKQPQPA